jgi:hypothetical protein
MTDPATGLLQAAADEALLEQLAEALRPEPRTPSPASVAALRRAVAQKWRPTAWAQVTRRLLAWARRLQRTGAAVAVFGGLAVGGTGMALAAGGSMHEPIPYRPHDPGIPVVAPAAQHPGGQVAVGPRPAPLPKPTTLPRRGTNPLISGATAKTIIVPTPGRTVSGDGASLPRRWSTPSTGRIQTPGICGAYRCASRPGPGATYPAPRFQTNRTAWSGATTAGSWTAGRDPAQSSAGGFATASNTSWTTTASSWDRQAPAGSFGNAAYTTTRYRDTRSDTGW